MFHQNLYAYNLKLKIDNGRNERVSFSANRHFTLFFVIILILVGVLAYLLLSNLLVVYVLPIDALWASVVVTIVLVIVNIYYAYQNRQVLKEMETTRKTDFITHVRAELTWYVPTFLVLTLTNFGKGTAIHINAEIEFEPLSIRKHWNDGTLAPNEAINIFLPNGNVEIVRKSLDRIIVKGTYRDIFETEYKLAYEIPVKQFIEETNELNPVYEQDKLITVIHNLSTEIRGEIRHLGQANQSVKTELGKINEVLEDLAKQENGEKYVQIIEELTKVTSNLERIAVGQEIRNLRDKVNLPNE
jgi:hypothetical protein